MSSSTPAPATPGTPSVALPSIEECLFGVTGVAPSLEPQLSISQQQSVNDYDAFLVPGRWGDAATQHDIPMAQLRKICSQGIVDEGSPRGVAWRVLLGYLPAKNITKSWPEVVPKQRELYQSLVQEYLQAFDNVQGAQLRGNLSKQLEDVNLRNKLNRLQRWDSKEEEDETQETSHHSSSHVSDDDDEGAPTSPRKQNGSSKMLRVVDQLPPKFQTLWKQSGISLDKSVATESSTAQALGRNHLRVPKFDESSSSVEEQQSAFDVLLEDAKLLEEIRKDVVRTHPDLFFYLEPRDNLGLRRYGALERILFVWAKLNKGVRYVQGMNEIVGTIFYVLANDHNAEWANNAEADSYFLFHALMMEMKDVFVPDLDSHSSGIQGRIDNMQRLLETHDPELYEHLQECGIDTSFYAIRWLTTLLSREFLLPDTIRLWDSMFASSHKENFFRYVCGTVVMMVREDLLKGDFSTCLRLLQSYPPANVDDILESSRSLWVYESQITLVCHKGGISLHQASQTVSPPPAVIMAFGLRGGVAPKISEQISAKAHQVQESVQTAKDGLMGRAKRLWNGWGTEQAETIALDATTKSEGTEAISSAPPAVPPPHSRIWNRGRSDPTDSTSGAPVKPETVTPKRQIWNRGAAESSPATPGAGTSASVAT